MMTDKLQGLVKRWFDSLDKGTPDYSIYESEDYIEDVINCYTAFSSKYLFDIEDPSYFPPNGIVKDMGEVKTVADLGCGVGLSTAHLKRIFPNAKVIGTNFDNTPQMREARQRARDWDFEILPLVEIGKVDLVFASEYFEHFINPIRHLRDVVAMLDPRYFLIANSFRSRAMGHFQYYEVEYQGKETMFHNLVMPQIFDGALSELDYIKVKTTLPFDRPAYWKR